MDPKVIVIFSVICFIATHISFIQGLSGKLAIIAKNLFGEHRPQAGFLVGAIKL